MQTSGCKINTRDIMYNTMTIANTAVPVHALSCRLLWTIACQASVLGITQQEYCRGLTYLSFSWGTFATHRSNSGLALGVRFQFALRKPGKPNTVVLYIENPWETVNLRVLFTRKVLFPVFSFFSLYLDERMNII